jgi:antitoxin component YwqK of YwqJK toxin-antitoxin module
MKPNMTVVAMLAISLLSGCFGSITKEKTNTIDVEQRQVRDGTVYEANDPEPYTGVVTSFYENGQIATEEVYVDGKKQGKSLGWHENGQQKLEVNYVDGKEQGMAITWDKNGQKTLELNFLDGEIVPQTGP